MSDTATKRKRRITIRKDRTAEVRDQYPWHYTVEFDPPREDAMDYGSMATWVETLEVAAWALTHYSNDPDAAPMTLKAGLR